MPRQTPIKFRRGTATEWGNAHPVVLDSGEPGLDSTNNLLKVGDGSTNWNALSGVQLKPTINTATDASSVNFDLDLSRIHTLVLGGNRSLSVSNMNVGETFIIRLTQDSTGSRTVTWFSDINWPGNLEPTLTTTANKTDVFGFICTSTTNPSGPPESYDGFVIGYNL